MNSSSGSVLAWVMADLHVLNSREKKLRNSRKLKLEHVKQTDINLRIDTKTQYYVQPNNL